MDVTSNIYSRNFFYERSSFPEKNEENVSNEKREKGENEEKIADRKQENKKTKDEEDRKQALKLQAIDTKVRNHEMAHMSVGGQFAGSPSFEYQTGPDGKQYAVGGEVPIEISTGKTPQETVQRMQQVRAAAMAPADPSPQDQAVAAKASQIAMRAMQEIADNNKTEAKATYRNDGSKENIEKTEKKINVGKNISTYA